MARALGIGGLFIRARDPAALTAWYRDRLGIGAGEHGMWAQEAGTTVFSAFQQDSTYFDRDRPFMLNLRVDDLDALIAVFRQHGETVETRPEWETAYGRFARVHDPEGNPVELWQG